MLHHRLTWIIFVVIAAVCVDVLISVDGLLTDVLLTRTIYPPSSLSLIRSSRSHQDFVSYPHISTSFQRAARNTKSNALIFSTIPTHHSIMDDNRNHAMFRSMSVSRILNNVLNLNEVTKWRIAAVSFLSTVLLNQIYIDQQLIRLWTYLSTSQTSIIARIFRTDSYEWCLAIVSFFIFIHGFGIMDRQVHMASSRGKYVHPWRKYRLQDRYIADQKRRHLQSIDDPANTSVDTSSSNFIVKPTPWYYQAWVFEFWVYALPLLTWDIVSPRRHRRLAAFTAPTTIQIMKDVTCGLLLYDFLFFCGHYMMHKIPMIYRAVHAKHHSVAEVRACDIVRLSLVEEVLEVGFSIIALNILGAHPISRSIYNVIIVFLLTELHCGFDLPWTPQNVIPFGLATGSRRHHYHHRFGYHYYQKFFFTFDRFFGFYQKNDGSLKGDSVSSTAYIPTSWKAV